MNVMIWRKNISKVGRKLRLVWRSFEKESNQGANLMDAWHQMASSIHSKPSTSLPINYPFIVYVNKRRRSSIRNRKNVQEGREGGGGISENSQKIVFFCSMGKKDNVKVVIFKNIQIYKNCHFPNLIFSRCTPLLLILMWCHFGINIIELVFLQMLHPLGANCAPLLLPCYHMTHRSCCCCYWSCYCTLTEFYILKC